MPAIPYVRRLTCVVVLGVALAMGTTTLAGSAGAAVAAPEPRARTTQDSASIFWGAVKGASRYDLCLQRPGRSACAARATTTRVSHVFRTLRPAAGVDYRVTVRAVGGSGSRTSKPVDVVLRPPTPRVVARAAQQSASVEWTALQDVDSYEVCLTPGASPRRPCALVRETTGTRVTFGALEPRAGTDYVAVVRASTGSLTTDSTAVPIELTARVTAPVGVTHRAGRNSATITWTASPSATSYDVCVSRGAGTTCTKTTPRTSGTTAAVYGLVGSLGTDYTYTVRAYRGGLVAASTRRGLDLQVGDVTDVVVASTTPESLGLIWSRTTNAERYRAEISPSATFVSGVRTLDVTEAAANFADLAPGVRYYVRVRANNGPTSSPSATTTTRVLPTRTTTVRVVTYNLCGQDKCRASTGIGSWASRKSLAARAALGTNASIISTQESGDRDTNFGSVLPGFRRAAYQSAKSLFYRTSVFTLNRSGALTLDAKRKRYAVWAELVDKESGTPFIVVDPHLEPGKGKTNDDLRWAQTRRMLSLVKALNTRDLDVVYAGDVNSNKHNATYSGGYDAVRKAFLAAGYRSALDVARAAATDDDPDGNADNASYNSANQGRVLPIRNGDHVDAVYISPGVGTRHWKVVIDLDGPNKYRTPFASDHNPLTAMLTIPGRPAQP